MKNLETPGKTGRVGRSVNISGQIVCAMRTNESLVLHDI